MSTATPWSRCRTMRRCTNSIEPTSRPRVGWLATSTLWSRPSSLARMTFCWLPPDSVPTGVSADWVRTSNSSTRSRRVAGDGAQVEVDARGERRLVVGVQDHVVGHREGADQPVFLPVLGDVGDPRVQPLPGRAVGEVAAVQPDVPGRDRPEPEQRLAQLGLPVALHARQAEDLARADLERHLVHPDPAGLVRDRQVMDVEHDLAGLGRVLARPSAARSGRPSSRRARPRSRTAPSGRPPRRGAAR